MTDTLMLAITARVRLNHLAQPMTLTGTLPNATVGTAYSGHLTLGGTFTAPVTIDASVGAIPAWMTVTVTGTDIAFTGTAPATAETDTFTVRATDSSATPQVAASPQSVVVSAASSGPAYVQSAIGNGNGTSKTLTLAAAPTAGNWLVLMGVMAHTEYTVSLSTSGWTRVSGLPQQNSSVGLDMWIKQAGASEPAALTITRSASHYMAWALMEVSSTSGAISSTYFNPALPTSGSTTGTIVNPFLGTIPAGVSNALPVMFFGWYDGSSGGTPSQRASGWTQKAIVPSISNLMPMGLWVGNSLSNGSAIPFTVDNNTNNTFGRTPLGAFLLEAP